MSRRVIPARPRSKAKIENLALNLVRRLQPGVLTGGERFEIERFFDCYLEELTGVVADYQEAEKDPG